MIKQYQFINTHLIADGVGIFDKFGYSRL